MVASKKEAQEGLKEEVKTIKAQLESLHDCHKVELKKEKKKVVQVKADLKKAKDG